MFSSLKTLMILMVLSLTLSGCGDLLGTKVIKRELDTSQFEVNCELDLDKFQDIMHENIGSQIRCLGENLNLFIRVVKSGKPGYLSRTQLEQYLARHRPDVKPEVIKALKSVFDLGHLITGEDPNYISKVTVDKVINFALIFNQEAALNFGPTFQNESPASYTLHQDHRDRVTRANKAIVQALRTIFNPDRGGQVHKLNIVELLESFTTEVNRPDIERAKKVLFLKKVLLGGDNEVISHNELEKLILNFDHLILISLDIVRYKYIMLKQASILELLNRDVNDLYNIIKGSLNDGETLFTMQQAMDAAKLFISPEKFDIDKFKKLITEAKKIAVKGNGSEVKGIELKALFTHAKNVLQTGTVFHRIYDFFKAELADESKPVEETIDFDEYRHTYPHHQKELEQFERITKKYRFMKGEFLSAYYIRGYKRNADAVFEIALFEYVIKLLFEAYGQPSDGIGDYSLDQFMMQKLVFDFENELIELGLLVPLKAMTTADNISLLGTLFQYQSDKNGLLDVNEATEFGSSLFSSMNISADLQAHFKEENCEMDKFDRTSPACFKANFWVGLCKYYRNNFPLMFESFNAPMDCGAGEQRNSPDEMPFWVTPEMITFLNRSIDAARTCNHYTDGDKEEIPYSEGDTMTIMLAMMHAETTILRWDVNKNNYMDPSEVDKSYEIYSPALDGFLETKSALIKKLKKQIFQYLVKYEQVPDEKEFKSIWKFVKFLLSFNKKAPGNRKTIVSILDVIGKENEKIYTGPKFDCNWLRDPENIPREMPVNNKPMKKPGFSDEEIKNSLGAIVSMLSYYSDSGIQLLKDQMLEFSKDMIEGKVKKISQVRQPLLKGLFETIARDPALMKNIHLLVDEGTELEKISLAFLTILLE